MYYYSICVRKLLENLIELVIDASKGKLNINTAIDVGIETTKSCFKFWYRRFKKA